MLLVPEILLIAATLLSASLAQAPQCGVNADVSINASSTVTTFQPFDFPFGPYSDDSETWTWTLDTVSYDMHGPNGTAEQRLWLSTQLQVNLTNPQFGFLGCGMILHGLRHGTIKHGQDDPGNCTSIFNSGCLRALDNSTNLTSQSLSPLVGHGNAQDLCNRLVNLGTNGAYGLPDECSDAFLDDAWIQPFVFASPQTEYICSSDPGAGSQWDPLAVWGTGSYNTADMTTYDNLTTSVVPVMVTLFTNRTVNDTRASQDYTGQELMCLRPSRISAGSASPTSIPNAAPATSASSTWYLLASIAGTLLLVII